jgi:CheY-like chemotaxis protein
MSQTFDILIVEDDLPLAYGWKRSLEEVGYRVHHIDSAMDAPPLLVNDYDCFLIDLFHFKDSRITREGGIGLISTLNEKRTYVKKKQLLISVSGHYMDKENFYVPTEKLVTSLGADIFFKKPVDIETIIDTIETWRKTGKVPVQQY